MFVGGRRHRGVLEAKEGFRSRFTQFIEEKVVQFLAFRKKKGSSTTKKSPRNFRIL